MSTEGTHLDIERHMVVCPDGTRTLFSTPDGLVMPIHHAISRFPYDILEIYRDTYNGAWRDAMAAEGPSTFVGTKESAALHEAGHVIVARTIGFNPIWARIWTEPGGSWVGFTECSDPPFTIGPPAQPEGNLKGAKNVMAGFIAERVLEGNAAKIGSSLDERVAALLMGTWAAAGAGRRGDAWAYYREIENSVAETIATNEAVARDIARALIDLAPDKLEGRQLDEMLARIPAPAPPTPKRAEARRLRQMAKRGKAA